MNSIYQINKGINKPIEFKGLKAQYIAYLGIGFVCLLLLFAILYICGVNLYLCMGIVGTAGTILFNWVSKCSRKYGRYGLMKKIAQKRVPVSLRFQTRELFQLLTRKTQ